LNRTTIRLIRSKNLTQNDFLSLRLPQSDRLLEEHLHDAHQKALARLLNDFNHFIDVVTTINIKSEEEQLIAKQEATDIGEHGFVLLLTLIDLMERLDFPHQRKEIEQVSLIFDTG
jgi:hypothetical protein